ncbi:hypothetical protein KAR91_82475 [Candidatus Pacearchaeota archaeon]|jgi:hypothetical protein|nr:hypothetical protein [Candidatus Pacearchaeota archaeon]
MSHSITVKLNKPANEFQAGEYTGFNVRGGVQYYDRKSKEKEWTNYSAVVFVKNPKQIQFYQSALVEGAIVEIGAKQQKIDIYNGNNGPVHSIEMIDAWIGSINQSVDRKGYAQQNQEPETLKVDNNFGDMDSSIPF